MSRNISIGRICGKFYQKFVNLIKGKKTSKKEEQPPAPSLKEQLRSGFREAKDEFNKGYDGNK